jgi:hypothetical protein
MNQASVVFCKFFFVTLFQRARKEATSAQKMARSGPRAVKMRFFFDVDRHGKKSLK